MEQSYISLDNLLVKIVKTGVTIKFQDKYKLRYNNYQIQNNAKILDNWNISDNCLWDSIVFGYKDKFPYDKVFKTTKLLGVIIFDNGAHKIILKLINKGFNKSLFNIDLNIFMREYKIKNNIGGTYFNLSD